MVHSAGFAGYEWFSQFRLDYRNGQPGLWHGVIRAWNSLDGFVLPSPPVQEDMPSENILSELLPQMVQERAEIERLRMLVSAYERGRFMRFMRWLHQIRHRLSRRDK